MKSRKKNKYIKKDDYYIGFFNNSDERYFVDEDTYEKIKDYNCYYQKGRVLVHYKGHCKSLAKIVFDIEDKDTNVLHINNNSLDYRKNNLYIGNIYYI